jgi:hypothetical protein
MQTLRLPYTPHPNPLPKGRGDRAFSEASIAERKGFYTYGIFDTKTGSRLYLSGNGH